MALDELYGLGYRNYEKHSKEIGSVTKEDIIDAAKEVFNPGKYAIVEVHSSKY